MAKPIIYNNSTTASINTWSLAVPSNDLRDKVVIENISANIMLLGIDDGSGNITQVAELASKETYTEQDYKGSLFVRSGNASQAYLATEYIINFTVGSKIKDIIKDDTNGFALSDGKVNEINRYAEVMANQVGAYPYVWYNPKYSSLSDSGTPANATNTTVFNLGTKPRESVWLREGKDGDSNSVYDSINLTNGTASTLTGLLDVSTIGTDRPLYNLASNKSIATGITPATGHFTFAASLDLATSTNQTILSSAGNNGVSITTNASSQVVFGITQGEKVTFATPLTTNATSIFVTYDVFAGEAILYIDGRQVDTADRLTFFANITANTMTVGSFNGLLSNIMIFNSFLDWEQARNLHYLLSYSQNILSMPQIILQPSPKPPFSASVSNRLAQDGNTPYVWSSQQYQKYTNKLQSFYDNGGAIPQIYIDGDLSVHPNIFTNTATLATQTIALPVGSFTFYFESGDGSITSANNTGIATGHGAVTSESSRTITVTTAGTFNFTVTGTVQKASLVVGASEIPYQERNATTILVKNLGSAGVAGDSSFAGSGVVNNANCMGNDAVAGRCFKPNRTILRYIEIPKTFAVGGVTPINVNGWFKFDNTGDDGLFRLGSEIALIKDSTEKIQFILNSFTANDRVTSTNTVTTGVWYYLVGQFDGTNIKIYINGVLRGSVIPTGTYANITDNYRLGASTAGSNYLRGLIKEFNLSKTPMTDAQVLQVFEDNKARFGL